jgi:hypothetical protein
LVHIFFPTSSGEHVLGEIEYALPLPIVGVKESFNMVPRTVDRLRMSHSMLMKEDKTLHLEADIFLRHRHLNPSFTDASLHQDIW